MSTEEIKSRIRKLLNLANDKSAFEGEIQNALRFARRLQLEHNITADDLEEPEDPHEIAARAEYDEASAYTEGKDFSSWEGVLCQAICLLMGTINHYRTFEKVPKKSALGTLVFDDDGSPMTATRHVFYGPAEDARDATEIFNEWVHIIATMGRMKYGGAFRGEGRSYCEGFAMGLFKGVDAIRKEETRAGSWNISEGAPSAGALVVIRATDLMAAKLEYAETWLKKERGIKLHKPAPRANPQDPGAYKNGLKDGEKQKLSHSRKKKLPT